MTTPNVARLVADHADDGVTEARQDMEQAAQVLADKTRQLATVMAYDALQRALRGGNS